MASGLRSGCLRLKPDESDIDENKVGDMKQPVLDLNDEPFLEKEEIEECREEGGVVQKVGKLNEDGGKKIIPVEDNEDNRDDSVKKKVEEGLVSTVQFSGRVLRSRSTLKTGSVDEGDKFKGRVAKTEDGNSSEAKATDVVEEGDDQSHSKMETPKLGRPPELKRKRGRPPKVLGNGVAVKEEFTIDAGGMDCSDGECKASKSKQPNVLGRDVYAKEKITIASGDSDCFDRDVSTVSKPKRGRPRKVQENSGVEKEIKLEAEESDQSDGGIKKSNHNRGLGRPMKGQRTEGIEKERVIRKRGRPPKLQGHGKGLKGRLVDGRKRLGGLRKGRNKLRGTLKFNMPANTSYSEKRLFGKESNPKRFVSANKDRFDDMEKNDSSKDSLMLRPKEKELKKAVDEVELRRSEAKQAVRDRIVHLLLAAGWTIDYRPRNNKQYLDAVYVNPEGRTHWSVTLAYKVLKNYYENGESKACPNGFVFTPIPEEELSILNRVVTKQRADKGKPKGVDDDTVDDGQGKKKMNKRKRKWKENEKKKKQKLLKGNLSRHEEDNSDGTFQRGTQVSSRKHKLQQTQKGKRYALLARNSMDGAESDKHGYVLYDGKRTLLSWMMDSGTVRQDGKVEYLIQRRTRTRESKCGRITRDGIQCDCCSDVFTIAEFETHAGSKLHQPFLNICLDTGVPLLQCLLDAWNNQQEPERNGFHFVDFGGEDPNDDTCAICGDGGDLICCDSCPSTFHQSCLDIEAFPSGNWNCVYCKCKYCGMVGNTQKRGKDEDTNPTVLTCQLCEEKYHEPCIQPVDAFNDDSDSAFFCGKRCKELFERLQMLVGVKHKLPEGFSWTLVQRFDIGSDVSLNEVYQKVESNSKLAVALSVMDECFLPLVDHRSGINLIHNIVYNFWSNFTRLNYSGFYTAILERRDEIIAAASIRIHGNQLAEMPFIGTRYAYRRQGMCRRLLSAIESTLSSLHVEKLVIPAVPEVRETWTSIFGFEPLETACKTKMRSMNMMVFPGVDMLQKPLLTHIVEEQMMGEASYKSGEKRTVVFDLNVSAESPAPETDERNDECTAVGLTTLLHDDSLEHTSDIMAEAINLPESATVSSSCIPAPEERTNLEFDSQSIYSKEKTDDYIVKQNLDSMHEGSVKLTNNIVHTDNEVVVRVNVSKDAAKDVTNSFDGTVQMSKDAIEATNQTSSTTQCDQHAANGHYDVASNVDKSGSSREGDKMDASGEVSATIDVSLSYNRCKFSNSLIISSTEVVSAGSEVAMSNIHDQRNINCSAL